jgi:hypothetical protein
MGSPLKQTSKLDDEEDEEFFPGRMPEGEGASPSYDIFMAVTAVSKCCCTVVRLISTNDSPTGSLGDPGANLCMSTTIPVK